MNDTAYLSTLWILTQGVRVIGTSDLYNLTSIILNHLFGFDHVAITQPYLATEHQSLVFTIGLFSKIFPINVSLTGKRQLTSA